MKYEFSKEDVAMLCKAMAEFCRHQPDPMIASENFRNLRIKLETQGFLEESEKKDEPQKEV